METPAPKRRWFQFSLRTLLVFVTVCAIACSWLAVKMRQAERQRKAVEAIRKLGGDVFYDWQCDAMGNPVATPTPTGPPWLRGTLGDDFFWKVVGVSLDNINQTDAGLDSLKGLCQLQSLYLLGTRVTDGGLEHLKGPSHLQTLDLAYTQVTDAGLENLKGLSQLQVLNLVGTRVTDAGLENLTGLSKLQGLSLSGTQVTDEGVKKLQQALPNCKIIR